MRFSLGRDGRARAALTVNTRPPVLARVDGMVAWGKRYIDAIGTKRRGFEDTGDKWCGNDLGVLFRIDQGLISSSACTYALSVPTWILEWVF